MPELTFSIAITIFFFFAILAVISAVIGVSRESGTWGGIFVIFLVLGLISGIVAVNQNTEEDDERFSARGCITLGNVAVPVEYGGETYYTDEEYLTVCKVK